MAITEFKGEYEFLSNFYPVAIKYECLAYPSSEAAFQAAKSLSHEVRLRFTTMTPSEAKKQGRHVELRSNWDKIKNTIMREILMDKFSHNEDLKLKLLATGDEELIEGNTWGDKYWGVCNGVGENWLGKILMDVRTEMSYLI